MRLISAHIRGYGRLVDAKINLDSKVIAVVGPNEAGKTTLLKALAHIDSSESVVLPQRSRAVEVSDSTATVTVNFLLDDDDRAAVAEFDLDDAPQSMAVSRMAGGGDITVRFHPVPRKTRAPIVDAANRLRRALRARSLDDWIDPSTTYADPGSDAARDYRSELAALVDELDAIVDEDVPSHDAGLAERTRSLLSGTVEESETVALRRALDAVISWVDREEPLPHVRRRLWGRSPDFLLFDEADRTIASAYTLDENLLAQVPASLKNLAGMADLDLTNLLLFVQTGDVGRRDTAVMQANTRLRALFEEAWKQSRLAVRFSVDGPLLRIVIWEDGDSITVFDERSAGLRMFVALIAFLRTHGTERPPVLLIDEAENHLHIDAQADLVNMFARQEQAIKVIYTTHSPACLPQDLGSGIRSVVPRKDNQQISDIKNSFWQGSAGYSPLMLAMGAAAAAFTPARCVVLAEGATEMILLPTLVRAATGLETLPYQVAPGLSEVPKDFYSKLDLEGAKVAYLLDGDGGGDDLAKGSLRAGVPAELIIRLEVPGIENLLEQPTYREAVATLLGEINPTATIATLPQLGAPTEYSWAKQLDTWIDAEGLKGPSKVAVANWLVENAKAEPSVDGRRQLSDLHRLLCESVGGDV